MAKMTEERLLDLTMKATLAEDNEGDFTLELLCEIRRLQRELEQAKQLAGHYHDIIAELMLGADAATVKRAESAEQERDALAAQVGTVLEALEEYGWHGYSCALSNKRPAKIDGCTCGLKAALSSTPASSLQRHDAELTAKVLKQAADSHPKFRDLYVGELTVRERLLERARAQES